jgi:hypothetical protein
LKPFRRADGSSCQCRWVEFSLFLFTNQAFQRARQTPRGFFEETSAPSPRPQQDISRTIGIAQKYGLEILPPPA